MIESDIVFVVRSRDHSLVSIGLSAQEAWMKAADNNLATHLRQVHELGYRLYEYTLKELK